MTFVVFVVSLPIPRGGHRSRDRIVVWFTTTNINAINAYHHYICEFESYS